MRPTSYCSSCKAPIAWKTTDTGGRMPLDPDPVPDGNIIIVPLPEVRWTSYVAHVLRKDEDPPEGAKRFVSHFATCDNPQRFRRGA